MVINEMLMRRKLPVKTPDLLVISSLMMQIC